MYWEIKLKFPQAILLMKAVWPNQEAKLVNNHLILTWNQLFIKLKFL